MKRKILQILTLFSIIFTFVISSCSDGIITECETDNTAVIAQINKFSDIQEKIFNVSCASPGCHAGSPLQANLNLTAGNSYSNLVNKTSLLNPNFVRVKPGDSQNSYLIKMLRNTGEATSLMPPGIGLDPNKIDSIAAWIDRGAPNN